MPVDIDVAWVVNTFPNPNPHRTEADWVKFEETLDKVATAEDPRDLLDGATSALTVTLYNETTFTIQACATVALYLMGLEKGIKAGRQIMEAAREGRFRSDPLKPIRESIQRHRAEWAKHAAG